MKNSKYTNNQEYRIPNTLGIVGVEGSGKTTILKNASLKLEQKKKLE
jgi:adenylate kinase